MKKKKKAIVYILLLALMFMVLILKDSIFSDNENKVYNISIITRGKMNESRRIMKSGAEQAASEVNANIKFISLSKENNVEEQIENIKKEISNESDAILIDPASYEELSETIEKVNKDKPVVLIDSDINIKNKINKVSCDNYALGVDLAREILNHQVKDEKVVVVKNGLDCSSIKERYDGFIDTMNKSNNTLLYWNMSDEETEKYYSQAKSFLQYNSVDSIVAFDSYILQNIGEAKRSLNAEGSEAECSIKLYGAGSDSKIISLLENRQITAIATENEFNIGYLGVKNAVDKVSDRKVDDSIIRSTVINSDNMYSKENQRLLFSFVK